MKWALSSHRNWAWPSPWQKTPSGGFGVTALGVLPKRQGHSPVCAHVVTWLRTWEPRPPIQAGWTMGASSSTARHQGNLNQPQGRPEGSDQDSDGTRFGSLSAHAPTSSNEGEALVFEIIIHTEFTFAKPMVLTYWKSCAAVITISRIFHHPKKKPHPNQ